MVPGEKVKFSLNCYISRNILFIATNGFQYYSHAFSDDILGGLELQKFVCHVFVTSSNMTSQYDILTFFYSGNDQDTYPGQCAKFGDKMCKECKLAPDDRFQGPFGPSVFHTL